MHPHVVNASLTISLNADTYIDKLKNIVLY